MFVHECMHIAQFSFTYFGMDVLKYTEVYEMFQSLDMQKTHLGTRFIQGMQKKRNLNIKIKSNTT
jgi:hypothetical protein